MSLATSLNDGIFYTVDDNTEEGTRVNLRDLAGRILIESESPVSIGLDQTAELGMLMYALGNVDNDSIVELLEGFEIGVEENNKLIKRLLNLAELLEEKD